LSGRLSPLTSASASRPSAEPELKPTLIPAVLFLVEGASVPDDAAAYQRLVLLFDGNDEDALAAARADWKRVKAAGHEATYWQQDTRGRWEKKA
jgi:DNA polymerase IIIc chi subunit